MRSFRFVAVPTAFAAARFYTALPKLTKPAGKDASLPELAFDWREGVKPVLSARQVELHLQKHHKAYVDKLNSLAKDKKYDNKPIEEIALMALESKEQVLFNQAAQHFNHTFYWNCVTPNGTQLGDKLKKAIEKDFKSVEEFKKEFESKGMANFGSGWTWLVWDPSASKLKVHNTSNAGFPLVDKLRPVFTADVWEHAYYKDFENRRADYLHEFWNIANWKFAEEMFDLARK
jgi:Fe-Mn family superoxide dismutase